MAFLFRGTCFRRGALGHEMPKIVSIWWGLLKQGQIHWQSWITGNHHDSIWQLMWFSSPILPVCYCSRSLTSTKDALTVMISGKDRQGGAGFLAQGHFFCVLAPRATVTTWWLSSQLCLGNSGLEAASRRKNGRHKRSRSGFSWILNRLYEMERDSFLPRLGLSQDISI